jgi:large-conductance mechanosensitive channel
MKKEKWLTISKILFTYLAINKVLYWVDTITAIEQTDIASVVGVVLTRLLNHDLIIIIGVVAFFFLDKRIELKKSKYSNLWENVIFYAIGYVGLMGIIFIYNVVLTLIIAAQSFSLGEFVGAFINFLPSGTLGYIAVVVVLEIKQRFKSKEKESSANVSPGTDDKLAMLQVLLDNDVLTQEEFDLKSAKLRSV